MVSTCHTPPFLTHELTVPEDISNNWGSIASIIDHWGDYSLALQKAAGPGHWNDST